MTYKAKVCDCCIVQVLMGLGTGIRLLNAGGFMGPGTGKCAKNFRRHAGVLDIGLSQWVERRKCSEQESAFAVFGSVP